MFLFAGNAYEASPLQCFSCVDCPKIHSSTSYVQCNNLNDFSEYIKVSDALEIKPLKETSSAVESTDSIPSENVVTHETTTKFLSSIPDTLNINDDFNRMRRYISVQNQFKCFRMQTQGI